MLTEKTFNLQVENIKTTPTLLNSPVHNEAEETIKAPRMEGIPRTAVICNVPVHFVRAKVLSGEVVAVRAGRRFLVNVDKFIEYLNTCTIAAPTVPEKAESGKIKPIDLRR